MTINDFKLFINSKNLNVLFNYIGTQNLAVNN